MAHTPASAWLCLLLVVSLSRHSPFASAPMSGLSVTCLRSSLPLFRGVDMTVPEGEFIGFLGPNGAGKTTTIKMFATLLSPTSGEVRVNGFDIRSEARKIRETIGYMAQETSIDPELTVEENIWFACEVYGFPRGE